MGPPNTGKVEPLGGPKKVFISTFYKNNWFGSKQRKCASINISQGKLTMQNLNVVNIFFIRTFFIRNSTITMILLCI